MFKLFKDLFTLYWILALTIGISLAGLGAYLEKISIVIFALIIPLLVMIVLEIIAQKRFKKINQIREINCNIARYYEELNQLRIKCKDKKLLSFLECNISVAFLDLGRYSDALCCLLGINIADLGKGTLDIQNQIIYFNNLAYVYMNTNRPEQAKRYIDFVLNYGGDTVYRAKTLQLKASGQGESL